MPIPSSISDLSPTAGSNSPAGSDPPTEGDNHIRALAAIVRQVYDAQADTTSASNGDALIGVKRVSSPAAGMTLHAWHEMQAVNVKEMGTGTELGALIQAAVNGGYTSIEIPHRTDWTWTTPVVLPNLWRGRLFSRQSKEQSGRIVASTGHNNPMIDAQGALFVEIEGFNVLASDSGGAAPACFVAFARMLSGASSSNHRISGCIVEGAFYYCCLYNVGAEELVFENNYWALYGSGQTNDVRLAPVVHQLGEDAFFSSIVTKQARTNGTSASAIQHRGDVIKQQNGAGCSAVYVGPNCNDITLDLAYGYADDASYFLTLGGYFDGIRLGVDRVETTKGTPIVYAPNDNDSGTVSLYKGSYRRSGAVNSGKYAVDIAGTTASKVAVHIASSVSWTGTFGGGTEDIYLLRSTKKTYADVSFMLGAVGETLLNSRVNIATLVNSSIAMGLAANLTVTTHVYGNRFHFFYDPSASNPAHDFRNGAKFSGAPTRVNGVTGSYEAVHSTVDANTNSVHTYFSNGNGIVGSISTNGSATTYATSSDQRLKHEIAEAQYQPTIVPSLRVRSFKWKADGEADVGFIAQELATVVPSAVVVGGEDARMAPWGVDAAKLVPLLVLEVQNLRAQVERLLSQQE